MPVYTFRNKETGEEHDEMMSIKDLDKFLRKNAQLEQVIKSVGLATHSNVSGKKPDAAFRDRLKDIKRTHSRGFTKSTINTF